MRLIIKALCYQIVVRATHLAPWTMVGQSTQKSDLYHQGAEEHLILQSLRSFCVRKSRATKSLILTDKVGKCSRKVQRL